MKTVLLTLPFMVMALAGCEPTGGGNYTSSAPVSQAQSFYGTIIDGRNITTSNNNDQLAGAVAGGIVGGLLANQLGGGRGRDVTTTLGVAGGALAGSRVAAGANDRNTIEWTVRLEDGRTINVVQNQSFRIGQRVRVIREGNRTRLVG